MLKALLAAFATSQAATRAERMALDAGYGMVALAAAIISLIFVSMAIFFRLSQSMSSAQAAAIMAAGIAVLAILVAVYARQQDSGVSKGSIYDQLGLSALGISSERDLEAIADQARVQIRRVGPMNVALAALAAGLLLGRKI
jgi:hypothetical protein